MPHSGIDYSADRGTPVVASNRGRVALLGEFFFAGRLVALDHGLGLYTLYFHLDGVAVTEGQMVERGETVGTVGTTGRSTGPHLHFAAQLGRARINPPDLYRFRLETEPPRRNSRARRQRPSTPRARRRGARSSVRPQGRR